MAFGLGGSVKKLLVQIDVATDAAQNKLQAFERQVASSATSVSDNVTGKIGDAQTTLNDFGVSTRGLGVATMVAAEGQATLADRIATVGKDASTASEMTDQFRMDMLSVMFAGMQLMSVFGGMLKSMFKFTGAADAMGAAMKSVLLPVTMALQPLLLSLSEILIGMSRTEKMILGIMVVILTLAGAVGFLGAQIVMLTSQLAGATIAMFGFELSVLGVLGLLTALAAGIAIGVVAAKAIEKVFGKLAAFFATVVVPALTLIAIAVGAITAPAWAVVAVIGILIGGLVAFSDEIVKAFSNLPKHIDNIVSGITNAVSGIVDFIGAKFDQLVKLITSWGGKAMEMAKKAGKMVFDALVFWYVELPIKVAKLLGKVVGKLISFASTAATKAKNIGLKIFNNIWNTISGLPGKIFSLMKSIATKISNSVSKVKDKALEIGSGIIDAIANGITNAPDAIMNAIKDIAPDWVVDVLGKAGSAVQSGIQSVTNAAGKVIPVNDFVMTPSGNVLKTAPDDFIFGTKTPGALQGGGGNDITINIDAEVASDLDMRELADKIQSRIDRQTGGRSNMGRSF